LIETQAIIRPGRHAHEHGVFARELLVCGMRVIHAESAPPACVDVGRFRDGQAICEKRLPVAGFYLAGLPSTIRSLMVSFAAPWSVKKPQGNVSITNIDNLRYCRQDSGQEDCP